MAGERTKLTKAQRRALDMMQTYGRVRRNCDGQWSRYPRGGFNSRTIWRLNELGLCGIGVNGAQITIAGRAALAGDRP